MKTSSWVDLDLHVRISNDSEVDIGDFVNTG